jgi:hypothetical protein
LGYFSLLALHRVLDPLLAQPYNTISGQSVSMFQPWRAELFVIARIEKSTLGGTDPDWALAVLIRAGTFFHGLE